MIGPAGVGKTTFAGRHFKPTQVVSSDHCRALVADDENDIIASPDAFAVLFLIADKRLRSGRLTVVDATNVQAKHRRPLVALARAHGRPLVAIVFALPVEVCIERDRLRPGRTVGPTGITRHWRFVEKSIPGLAGEGFDQVFVLDTSAALDTAEVELLRKR